MFAVSFSDKGAERMIADALDITPFLFNYLSPELPESTWKEDDYLMDRCMAAPGWKHAYVKTYSTEPGFIRDSVIDNITDHYYSEEFENR